MAGIKPRQNAGEKLLGSFGQFLKLESASGILLMVATALALLAANSPLTSLYDAFLTTPVAIQVGALEIAKPLLLWINDGLMSVFFLLVGLEIKREILDGELSEPSQIVLPGAAAIGGIVVPALIYVWLNMNDRGDLDGWAIPVATDIAFALGILMLFGRRVPTSLKVFLLTLAIFDDVGAIIIIAIFYSGDLSTTALMVAGLAWLAAVAMNRRGVMSIAPYLLVGLVMWVSVLKSGVHATLAGILLAFTIPMRDRDGGSSPLRALEKDLHPPVAYGILPLFAFANAGLSLSGLTVDDLLSPVSLGVALGLFLGKPIGVMLFAGLVVLSGAAQLPGNCNWRQLLGVATLSGVGFTMSLFIAGLAFQHSGQDQLLPDRLGILIGSGLAAIFASLILYLSLPRRDD